MGKHTLLHFATENVNMADSSFFLTRKLEEYYFTKNFFIFPIIWATELGKVVIVAAEIFAEFCTAEEYSIVVGSL